MTGQFVSNDPMEADEYTLMDQVEARMWWFCALHARLCDALAGISGPVLDAGCGTGGLLTRLAALPGLHPFGLDYVEPAARRAAEKSAAPVVCGSINALPFADASLAAAVSADVLSHVAVDPQAALAELFRTLRPGGRLVLNMPAYRWLLSAHDRRVQNSRRVTAREVRRWLEAAGFVRIRVRYWNSLLLPLMVVRRKLLARGDAASDVAAFPPWIETMFRAVSALERRLGLNLPAGGSVIAVAERPL